MAEVHGNGGTMSYTGLTAGVKSWSLDYSGDVHDTTDFADAAARTFVAGLTGWTATCELNWDAANTAAPGDSATLTLYVVASTTYYAGTAICTGLSVSTPVDGIAVATYSFQGTGALELTVP